MARNELATLIRLARLQLDEKRKVLAALLAEEERVKALKAALLAQMAQEAKAVPADFEAGLTRGAYIKAGLKRAEQFDTQLAQIAQVVEAAREDMAKAFEEVKRYEIADEARKERAAREASKRETKALDEVGSDRHQRKEREE